MNQTTNEIIAKARNLLSQGQLEDALEHLISIFNEIATHELRDRLIIIRHRYMDLKRMRIMGLIDKSFSDSSKNRLINDLLELTRELEQNTKKTTSVTQSIKSIIIKENWKNLNPKEQENYIEQIKKMLHLGDNFEVKIGNHG